MNSNAIISNMGRCASCLHEFINSFISFENLPLVEFKVDPKIPHSKVVEYLYTDKSKLPKYRKKKK